MAESKQYCGSGKSFTFPDGNKVFNLNVCLSNIPADEIREYNGKRYVRIVAAARREADKFGNDTAVYIDPFKPTPKEKTDDPPF